MKKTQRIEERARDSSDGRHPRSWLVRVGSAGSPMLPPDVISLEQRSSVRLGRKDDPPSRDPDRVETDDPWMSGEHAVLENGSEGWVLVDQGSSNGTLLWGKRRSTSLLADGDIFETGSTFWVFRTMVLADGAIPEVPTSNSVLASVHPPFIETCERALRVAPHRVPIVLCGPTGSGKEVVARAVHHASGRAGPFVAINTAAVQSNLVASELFGVERGAHSMAERSRQGQIRAADHGTLLLDEIGDMPLEVQVSLLRVLQESEVVPVGGDSPVKVDVRFVCATHQDLDRMVEAGDFRADLYARLKGTVVDIPALEDRIEDLGLLIARLLRRLDSEDIIFSPAAYRALMMYPWPLNVRELEKTLETAVALCERGRIEPENLPAEIRAFRPDRSDTDREQPTDQAREREIMRLLTAHHGNVSAVARSMGYSRMQVHRWLKQLNVDPSDYRGG